MSDTDRVKAYIEDHDVKRAVIVGAGFIGLEMAENLHEYGVKVSVVEMADQVMTPVDYEIATMEMCIRDRRMYRNHGREWFSCGVGNLWNGWI